MNWNGVGDGLMIISGFLLFIGSVFGFISLDKDERRFYWILCSVSIFGVIVGLLLVNVR